MELVVKVEHFLRLTSRLCVGVGTSWLMQGCHAQSPTPTHLESHLWVSYNVQACVVMHIVLYSLVRV